ncbi:MAG: signal peptidase I [Lachnospiraceae bacterium]|jgi:signal peptidase I|nr:signal peptidase I [Lachnospiraceae bacterium]MCI1397501.1 signal peptidase I [Lachnospiraceae bacterium]MCI1423251.1 signal peptidase I [Lachnospiraceae bacterium]MCI1452074.1 signal peptidase I [Lachnospiraceae bacterium]MDD5849527.1 signal peptidase I [Bacillota bacterium]
MSEEQQKQDPNKSTKSTVLSYVIWVGAVVLLAWFLITFVAQRTDVNGTSMVPTLEDGDQLICDKISYRFHDPERFDIIIFPYKYQKNTYFIKRVIGLPGETVRIDYDGSIYINGEILDEKYGLEKMTYPGIAEQEITLGDDEYFVLGDNRNVSEDSRYPDVGLIKREDIIGRAWLRIYPFSKFGLITHDLGADNLDVYSGLTTDTSGTLSTESD